LDWGMVRTLSTTGMVAARPAGCPAGLEGDNLTCSRVGTG
jgi:hypothetical protein